ncbi:MAG: hypothetical protein WC824_08210 [Bacteroidota bacterium]|jgi:hypothetical protein
MDIVLAGTGETIDLPIIIFGVALFFGVLFFSLWFPAWNRQRLIEKRTEKFLQTLEETYHGVEPSVEDENSDAPPC